MSINRKDGIDSIDQSKVGPNMAEWLEGLKKRNISGIQKQERGSMESLMRTR